MTYEHKNSGKPKCACAPGLGQTSAGPAGLIRVAGLP